MNMSFDKISNTREHIDTESSHAEGARLSENGKAVRFILCGVCVGCYMYVVLSNNRSRLRMSQGKVR